MQISALFIVKYLKYVLKKLAKIPEDLTVGYTTKTDMILHSH